MSILSQPPEKFLKYNSLQSKKLAIVVDIAGLDYLTSTSIGRRIRYNDPYNYGDPGLLYGGLIQIGTTAGERGQKQILDLSGSLSVSQRLEPEQGRAAISTLSMTFVDYQQYMTQVCASGVVIDEILGKEVRIWLGYAQNSFPDEYYVIWRGRVAQTTPEMGRVGIQFVDPSVVKRQQIFYMGKTQLDTTHITITSGVSDTQFNINLSDVPLLSVGQSLIVHDTGNTFVSPAVNVASIVGTLVTVDASLTFTPGSGYIVDTGLSDVATTINVVANGDFHKKILGPDGTYDENVRVYIKIDDEFIEYQQTGQEGTGFGTNQFLNVVRGARNNIIGFPTNAPHDAGADVDAFVQIGGHAIDLALKLQLSGWGGPYIENQTVLGLVITNDPDTPLVNNAIVLPVDIDAIRDLGITAGDYVTISGDAIPGNNVTAKVVSFRDLGLQPNRAIVTDFNFTASYPTTGVLAIRSQFDTFPTSCGASLPANEVDVAGHLYYKNTFLSDGSNSYRFLIDSEESAKTFIESQIMLPLGAYSLTRQGKLSMGLTKPPIADERTQQVDLTNTLEPQGIRVTRGINNRKYFNEIDWEFNFDDAGSATAKRKTLDTDSLNLIGISSVLPISAKGARTDLGFLLNVERRERFLLLRYAKAAVMLDIKTNFGTGNLIEAGDVIIISDNGQLQIPNLVTGERNYGVQLLEVINRSIDFKTGQVSLQLLGGIQSLVDDRYATITPSSLLTDESTSTRLVVTESFGGIFPGQEYKKWQDYIGLRMAVHDQNFTYYEEVVFTGFDPADNTALFVSPPLSFTPAPGDILDLAAYSTSTDNLDQAKAKLIHVFLSPSVAVVSGASNTQFDVGAGDIAKFSVGRTVIVHNADYTNLSDEVLVQSVVGNTITVDATLGFTPAGGDIVEFIGFADFDETKGSGASYRFV